MNCALCGHKATHAHKLANGSWSGRCAGCYDRSASALRLRFKRLVPMVCGREV